MRSLWVNFPVFLHCFTVISVIQQWWCQLSVSVYKMSTPSYLSAGRSTDTRESLLPCFISDDSFILLLDGYLFFIQCPANQEVISGRNKSHEKTSKGLFYCSWLMSVYIWRGLWKKEVKWTRKTDGRMEFLSVDKARNALLCSDLLPGWTVCCYVEVDQYLLFYNCIVPAGFLPWEIRVAFRRESQLQQRYTTQPTVHGGCFSVSIILLTLTWTTGSLSCAQMLMHAIAHAGVRTHVRESSLKVDSGRKIPCRTRESNLRQQCDGPLLYLWATSPPHIYTISIKVVSSFCSEI